MKALALSKHKIMFVAVLICLTVAGSISASAVLQKHTGKAVNTVTVVTESELSFIGSTSFSERVWGHSEGHGPRWQGPVGASRIQRGLVLSGFICRKLLPGEDSGGWS